MRRDGRRQRARVPRERQRHASVNFPETVLQRTRPHRVAIPHKNVPNMVAQILTRAGGAEHQHRRHAQPLARRAVVHARRSRCAAERGHVDSHPQHRRHSVVRVLPWPTPEPNWNGHEQTCVAVEGQTYAECQERDRARQRRRAEQSSAASIDGVDERDPASDRRACSLRQRDRRRQRA